MILIYIIGAALGWQAPAGVSKRSKEIGVRVFLS
jgi:hypothetical protein